MKKITLVGAGFIGSHLIEELCKLLYSQGENGRIKVIDFDRWEERNAANQNVSLQTAITEEYKAETLGSYISKYSNVEPIVITDKLVGANSIDLLSNSDLIIDAVDNIPTRQLLSGLSSSGGVAPCIHLGLSRKGDGIINWSSKNFTTFPFSPQNTAGRNLVEQDVKELPCQMYKYRSSGMPLFQAAIKAIAFFLGLDPWEMLGMTNRLDAGYMTCWETDGASATLRTEPTFLDPETEFFPIYTSVEVSV